MIIQCPHDLDAAITEKKNLLEIRALLSEAWMIAYHTGASLPAMEDAEAEVNAAIFEIGQDIARYECGDDLTEEGTGS